MKTLEAWVMERPNARHMLVRRAGSYVETRWRVAVWEKAEGEVSNGFVGEGHDEDLEKAAAAALKSLADQQPPGPRKARSWYLPNFMPDGRPFD